MKSKEELWGFLVKTEQDRREYLKGLFEFVPDTVIRELAYEEVHPAGGHAMQYGLCHLIRPDCRGRPSKSGARLLFYGFYKNAYRRGF